MAGISVDADLVARALAMIDKSGCTPEEAAEVISVEEQRAGTGRSVSANTLRRRLKAREKAKAKAKPDDDAKDREWRAASVTWLVNEGIPGLSTGDVFMLHDLVERLLKGE